MSWNVKSEGEGSLGGAERGARWVLRAIVLFWGAGVTRTGWEGVGLVERWRAVRWRREVSLGVVVGRLVVGFEVEVLLGLGREDEVARGDGAIEGFCGDALGGALS